MKEGALHVCDRENVAFIAGALVQGRAQFAEGTAEREVIDAIPTEPAQLPPAQAVISLAQSPAVGAVHLQFEAAHATTFQVWYKGPGEPIFTQVDTTVTGEYTAFGLPGGMHAYNIVGVNAAGAGGGVSEGPRSGIRET